MRLPPIRLSAVCRVMKIKWLPLFALAALFCAFFYFRLHHYLSFDVIKTYEAAVLQWTSHHYLLATSLYLLIFTLLIASGIPCGTVLTLLGGFLFGYIAILYAIFSTTAGGMILYLSIRTSIGGYIARRTSGWIKKVEHGFQENAFHYLLMLRLMPIFPCWVSNISAGVLNVPLKTFLLATILGITPATLIYVIAGRGLEKLFSMDNTSILIPLLGLAILSLFPVIYKQVKKQGHHQ